MQLKTYRDQYDLTLADIVQRLRDVGIPISGENVVNRHERGEREPRLRIIEAYRKATNGAVDYADWAELEARMRTQQPTTTEKVSV